MCFGLTLHLQLRAAQKASLSKALHSEATSGDTAPAFTRCPIQEDPAGHAPLGPGTERNMFTRKTTWGFVCGLSPHGILPPPREAGTLSAPAACPPRLLSSASRSISPFLLCLSTCADSVLNLMLIMSANCSDVFGTKKGYQQGNTPRDVRFT